MQVRYSACLPRSHPPGCLANQIEEVPAKMQHVLYMPMPDFKQSPLNKDDILDGDIRPCCLLLFPIRCAALSFLHLHQQIRETGTSGKSSSHQLSHSGTKSFSLTPEPGRRATWGLFSWPGCKPTMTCYSFVSMNKLLFPAPGSLPLPSWHSAGCL